MSRAHPIKKRKRKKSHLLAPFPRAQCVESRIQMQITAAPDGERMRCTLLSNELQAGGGRDEVREAPATSNSRSLSCNDRLPAGAGIPQTPPNNGRQCDAASGVITLTGCRHDCIQLGTKKRKGAKQHADPPNSLKKKKVSRL